MKRHTIGLLSAATVLLSAAPFALAEEANSFVEAFTGGKAGANIRARYEHVDVDGAAEKADAVTARLRLNYRTAQWNRLFALTDSWSLTPYYYYLDNQDISVFSTGTAGVRYDQVLDHVHG
jgi:hypothetical protein